MECLKPGRLISMPLAFALTLARFVLARSVHPPVRFATGTVSLTSFAFTIGPSAQVRSVHSTSKITSLLISRLPVPWTSQQPREPPPPIRSRRIWSRDHPSLFLSRQQGFRQEPAPHSHRKLAVRLVPACSRSRLVPRHLQAPTQSL